MVLKLALHIDCTKLQVFSDSLLVIDCLDFQKPLKDIFLMPIFEDTCRFINLFQEVSFKHIFRERNQLVNYLSKQGLQLPDVSYSAWEINKEPIK